MKKNIYAIIIGIENYKNALTFPKVHYAKNDAQAIQEVLISDVKIPSEQILCHFEDHAKYDDLNYEIAQFISSIPEDSTLILYYAGHGFFVNGKNYITTYDSAEGNMEQSSLEIGSLIIEPIDKRRIARCLLFLDCCSNEIAESSRGSRGLSAMNFDGLTDKTMFYRAIFISCSPHERAYPDDEFKHGIWTYYLKSTLAQMAKNNDGIGTDIELRDYLHSAVLERIEKTEPTRKQNPYAKINANSTVNLSNLFFGSDCEKTQKKSKFVRKNEILLEYSVTQYFLGQRSRYKMISSREDLELAIARKKYENKDICLSVNFPQNVELENMIAQTMSVAEKEKLKIYVRQNNEALNKRTDRLTKAVNVLFDEDFVSPFPLSERQYFDALNEVLNYFPDEDISSQKIKMAAVHKDTREYFIFFLEKSEFSSLELPSVLTTSWGYTLIDVYNKAGSRIICEFLIQSMRDMERLNRAIGKIGHLNHWNIGLD